ncbi:Alg9-like mannosyltransferase family-domain-containing protein [Infundibulicybe gibba]|nr:Alg9-like mannosyltransferase family-domain-containing protein [Infundibulicybe gibba]
MLPLQDRTESHIGCPHFQAETSLSRTEIYKTGEQESAKRSHPLLHNKVIKLKATSTWSRAACFRSLSATENLVSNASKIDFDIKNVSEHSSATPRTPKSSNATPKTFSPSVPTVSSRAQRRPWSPSFSLAVRILLLMRVTGAMYSNIDDCDEVYNFWEPLHFLDRGYGFQTWEVAPQFAIRSWAYILLHLFPARLAALLLGTDKRPTFFATRIFLAVICVLTEARFYRTVAEKMNERVGRYLFFMLLFSAGMWNASVGSLLALILCDVRDFIRIFVCTGSPSNANNRRTLMATLAFATGAIVGWPFALALAIPFVFEELFVFGKDVVPPTIKTSWLAYRWKRMIAAGFAATLIIVPAVGIDSLAYGKLTFAQWNIIRYNIFGGSQRGPDLYGTAPWDFYLLNLVLNFNVLVPLALLAVPALGVTYIVDRKRLGIIKPGPNQSSPFTILTIRLLPFYIWFGILTSQAHKEERFMFPAYPLLCFNAAVTLYLVRGWQEVLFISLTNSPYRASQSSLFRNFTFSVLVASSILSLSRIFALWEYYHAPMSVIYAFEVEEIPRLLNVTGLLPMRPPNLRDDELPRIDLAPIKDFNLQLCVSKEWYRFPGHYLVPDGVNVGFVKSAFDGMLPRHFETKTSKTAPHSASWWLRPETRYNPTDLNDLNKEDPSHYVSIQDCDYLVDLDFPKHPISSSLEPRYAVDPAWERVSCTPFLDARYSPLLSRTLWMPGQTWHELNEFGDYCLLKNKRRIASKEIEMKRS